MTETGVVVLDQTHVVMIDLIGSFSSKVCRSMGDDLFVDTDDQIGFPVDKSEIVRNRDHRHPFSQEVKYRIKLLFGAGINIGGRHGYTVTSIGSRAFGGCSLLRSVTVPATITSIAPWAFKHCYNLASVTLPAEMPLIGEDAFVGCSPTLALLQEQ